MRQQTRLSRRARALFAGACVALAAYLPAASPRAALAASQPAISVRGNLLVDGSGQEVRLLGINRSGTEYACIQGWGIFDGPSDDASVAAMAAWHINAVRVPLNEDCWLGINGVPAAYGGSAYRTAISDYVARLNRHNLYAILELHMNAPANQPAAGQQVMADADHSPAFWASVASAFTGNTGTLFDLYNEPHDITWDCWLNGCATPGWNTAGMQSLVTAVRGTGATQPLMLGGLQWSGDLSGWLSHQPVDPVSSLVASFHTYNFAACASSTCWDSTLLPVAGAVPVVTGEIGEDDCAHGYIDPYMAWADRHGISYLGWTWDTWDCRRGPALITDYSGTATAFGAGYRDHLLALSANPRHGYNILTGAGGIYSFGSATYWGNLIDHGYPGPAIGLSEMPAGDGYQVLTTVGGLFSFGSAAGRYHGNLIDHGYPGPAVAVGITGSGNGYAILNQDGGFYSFGDAAGHYYGNLIDNHFPGRAVSFAWTRTGAGYWILTDSGAIYSFGDAVYQGNLIDHGYPGQATSLARSAGGAGYHVLTREGAVYSFGDAVGDYAGNLLDHGYPGPGVALSTTP
ncbi:MAG: hypothetical protein NVSMB17_10210 [Candidatus Dormibacteria bacterium]